MHRLVQMRKLEYEDLYRYAKRGTQTPPWSFLNSDESHLTR